MHIRHLKKNRHRLILSWKRFLETTATPWWGHCLFCPGGQVAEVAARGAVSQLCCRSALHWDFMLQEVFFLYSCTVFPSEISLSQFAFFQKGNIFCWSNRSWEVWHSCLVSHRLCPKLLYCSIIHCSLIILYNGYSIVLLNSEQEIESLDIY